MRQNKILSILLLLTLVLALASCGKKPQTAQEVSQQYTQEVTEAAEDSIGAMMDAMQEAGQVAAEANIVLEEAQLAEESELTWTEVEGGVAVTDYSGGKTAVRIPDTLGGQPVVAIEYFAFEKEENLTVIELPESVTTIGDGAFNYCIALVAARMPGVVEIGQNAFEGCLLLQETEFSAELHTIERMAFTNCTALQYIDLPDTLTFLGSGAFLSAGLKEITIPGSLEKITSKAFYSCSSLEKVVVEEGVLSIGDDAFASASALKEVHIPASCDDLGYSIFSSQEDVVIYAPEGAAIEAYAENNGHTFKIG